MEDHQTVIFCIKQKQFFKIHTKLLKVGTY